MSALGPGKLIYQALDAVQGTLDPLGRAELATEMMHAIGAASEELRDVRRDALIEVREKGDLTLAQIGEHLGGIGRARVQQIISDVRAPRRPGVIETQTRLAVAGLRASGVSDETIVAEVLPQVLKFRGAKLSVERIADLLGVPAFWLAPRMPVTDVDLLADMAVEVTSPGRKSGKKPA